MTHALLCNYCGERIFPYIAYVVLPTSPPALGDFHYHVYCWEKIQRKAENSNPSPSEDRSG